MENNQRVHVKNCFGCSQENPIGLKIKFEIKDNKAFGKFQTNKNHEGPPGMVHGGIIAVALDDALSYMGRSSLQHDIRTMKETISFRNTAELGEELTVEAKISEEKSRAYLAVAKISSARGVIAQAEAMLLKGKLDKDEK